uniref:SCD domain-containing protein n=1 Tax=Strongyloides stercoralis TaxID=6248 RepID=A0A0K0E3Z8_STRER
MGYFSDSEEDITTNGSSFERQDACPPASQNFSVAIDVPTDSCSDEPVEDEDNYLNKLTQRNNRKMLYTQTMVNRNKNYNSQSTGSFKNLNLPSELKVFFQDVGLEVFDSEEYFVCIKVSDPSLEYNDLILKIKEYLNGNNLEKLITTISSIIKLKNGSDSLSILEVMSKPIKVNENFSNSFLQVLISIKQLQTRILQDVFKFFDGSASDDMVVKKACDIYLDLLKDVDEVYEQEQIYPTISNLNYDTFGISYRDEVVALIYKFINDCVLENDLYRNLMKWLRRNDLEELSSFRLALLESIKNVSADSTIIKSESLILIKNINSFDCKTAIEVINYTALSLTTDSNKNQILSFLLALKQNLNLDKFKASTEYDGIVCNMLNKIMMLVTNYGRIGINIVLSVLNNTNNTKITSADFGFISNVIEDELMDDNDGNGTDSDSDEEEEFKVSPVKYRFTEFDYILSITTISEYMNTFFDNKKLIIKLMATQLEHHPDSFDETCNIIDTLLKCEEFPLKNFDALMLIGEYFLKKNVPIVNEMGKFIFLEMFRNLCYDREKIVSLLIDNMYANSDVSYHALHTIYMIVKNCPFDFADYMDYYLERTAEYCIKFEPKRLRIYFKILSSLSISCSGEEAESKVFSIYDRFDHFFESFDENSFRAAILANIVRVCELIRRDPEKYSTEISRILEKLENYSSYKPEYRAYYFLEFSVNLKSGHKKFLKESKELVEYMNKKIFHTLKDTYFEYLERPLEYVTTEDGDLSPLFEGYNNVNAKYQMRHTVFLKRDFKNFGNLNVAMLNPLTPMIQFIYQVLRLVNNWKKQSEKSSLENLYFIFEANIDLHGISSMLEKEKLNDKEIFDLRRSIIFLLDYISNLLNTFADCRSSPEHNEIIQKKYRLYVKLEHILSNVINSKYKVFMTFPPLLCNSYNTSRHSFELFGIKKYGLQTKKKNLKTETDFDKCTLGNENMENANFGTLQYLRKTNFTKSDYKFIPFTKMSDYITPFNINVLIKCSDAFLEYPYLLSTVLNSMNYSISRIENSFVNKKIPSFGLSKSSKSVEPYFPYVDKQNKEYLKGLLSDCIIPMMKIFDYYKKNVNMEDLQYQNFGEQSLQIIYRSIKVNNDKDDCNGVKNIEKKIFQFIADNIPDLTNKDDDNTGMAILNYFFENEDFITSSSAMCVSVINMLYDFVDKDEVLRLKLAAKCLDLLDCPWPKNKNANSSSVSYCKDIARILEVYFSLISPKYQIPAVIYIITKKLIFLAPVNEQNNLKETTFSYKLNYAKLAVTDADAFCGFNAITQKSFSYVFNICFITINKSVQEFLTKNGDTSDDRVRKNLDLWYFAVACLNKLISYINISRFCTKAILSTVVKEGKKFIDFISSNKSTFVIYINDKKIYDGHKERFEQIFEEIKRSYSMLVSHNNDFLKKLTAGGLKVFPKFVCAFESFERYFNTISKINSESALLTSKKRGNNINEFDEPQKKKKKGSNKPLTAEDTENMEM